MVAALLLAATRSTGRNVSSCRSRRESGPACATGISTAVNWRDPVWRAGSLRP